MQLTGPGVWGPPSDLDAARGVLRRVVEEGVNFLDTADAYGPCTVEELICEALYPYPENLVIATKVGLVRTGPSHGNWIPVGRPEYLRQQVEMCLRRLRLERIDLLQLHRIDPTVPLVDQIGVLADLRQEGKIRHIGLSEVSVRELQSAQKIAPIASVQNLFNLADQSAHDLLEYAQAYGIVFIPYFPLATDGLPAGGAILDRIANDHGCTPKQVALAWLLKRSPVLVPIPGTSSIPHLLDNLRAARIDLAAHEISELAIRD
jgi:aryl-alcohol dehydrogenase-like predicted oxidoreductase